MRPDPEYPGGTQYRCDFSGQFTEPEKVNDYTYSVEIAALDYVEPAGSKEIKDGILYRYTDVYGLSRDGEILIYLPGRLWRSFPRSFAVGSATMTCQVRRMRHCPSTL